jgi:hypothetical protein
MVIICLSGDQWRKLEPHLPEEGVIKMSDGAAAFPMLDCREIPDETTYQKVLGIAQTHCPELVDEIEKNKRITDAHQ